MASSNSNNRNTVNVAVLLFSFNDPYMSQVKESFENIQKKNENAVKFTFFDGKNNQAIQNADINFAFNGNFDLLLINLADTRESIIDDIVIKAKYYNRILIFFNVGPQVIPPIVRTYNKIFLLQQMPNSLVFYREKYL